MADGKEVLNNGHKADTAVQPLDSPLVEKPPAPEPEESQEAEEPMESTGFNRRIDSAKKTQAGWNRMFETFIAPLIMEESVLHPEGREVNPSRLYMLVGGASLGVLGIAAWGFLSIPRANPDTALAARQRLAMQAGPTQPQQPLPLRPAQPQLPVQPIPTLQPVMQPQQQPGMPQQAMQPRPQGGQVQQRPVLQAGISRSTTSNRTMTDEQRRQQAKAEVMERVQMRSGNLGPLNGSSRSGPGPQISNSAQGFPQLPPPQALPQFQPLRQAALPRALPTMPIALNNPALIQQPITYPLVRSRTAIAQAGGQYANQSYGDGQSQGQGQAAGGYLGGQTQYPLQQGSYPIQQTNYPAQQMNPTMLSGGLQQTQTWGLVPPGNMIRAVTRSVVQVVKSGGSINTPVFAQVRGAVRVDGQEVIPDGAILNGRVVNVDEALGRVRIEFVSLTVGTANLPLSGAVAWTVTGESPETASISEGLVADAAGMPDYLFTDARSAVGQGAASVARTLGQTTTTGIGAFGASSVSSYTGDLNTSVQRAAAQGLSTFFNRQAGRADAATGKVEGRGPIWTVLPDREFVVILSEGI